MPQLTEPANLPPDPYNQTDLVFYNTTIRQTLRIATPASQLRIRLSNAFGLVDLHVTSITIALPASSPGQNLTGSSVIDPTTLQKLTFSGSTSIDVPPGALAVSDPIEFPVEISQIISLSLYLEPGQASQATTSHPGSRTTSWISRGDCTQATNLTDPSTISLDHWYYISAVEAWQEPSHSAFVLVGDSLTDGRGSDTNANNRWPDLLAARMQSPVPPVSIINQAAGGNRLLADGLGPSALSRIERDVLSHSGVRYVLLFKGVNDIGRAAAQADAQKQVTGRMVQAYQQIITRVHAMGTPIFGGTIAPFGCANVTIQPYSNPEREKTRQRVNKWIRESEGRQGGFDVVIDFDAVLRDPMNMTRLDRKYDVGDCIHPNVAGYTAMAEAFPVDVFAEFRDGVSGFV